MEKQNLLLFELSDDGNPITYNGAIVGSVSDVIEHVEAVSPELANVVTLIFNQQQKQIEELQKANNIAEALFANIDRSYNLAVENWQIAKTQYEKDYKEKHKTRCKDAQQLKCNISSYDGEILAYNHLKYVLQFLNRQNNIK